MSTLSIKSVPHDTPRFPLEQVFDTFFMGSIELDMLAIFHNCEVTERHHPAITTLFIELIGLVFNLAIIGGQPRRN